MKYTMNRRNDTITLDTENGNITGGTYGMKDVIKSDLDATWNPEMKLWNSDKLAETVEKYHDYLSRCYNLKPVKVETMTATSSSSVSCKEIVRKELVNGNDGFYQIIYFADGSTKRCFIG